MMPLESRVTSVLSPDERMWRRGLIKQMTKRAGLGQKKHRALHFFFSCYTDRFGKKTKPFAGGGRVCVWGSFGANLKCTVKQLANGQLGLDYKGKFTYSTRAL